VASLRWTHSQSLGAIRVRLNVPRWCRCVGAT
jgi:hypothetical protein